MIGSRSIKNAQCVTVAMVKITEKRVLILSVKFLVETKEKQKLANLINTYILNPCTILKTQ